jgi:Arc/MetJ family transcription regulator
MKKKRSRRGQRTNIVLDPELLRRAMRLTGVETKKGVVDAALRVLVGLRDQEGIRALWGKLEWEGDLGRLREGRFVDGAR